MSRARDRALRVPHGDARAGSVECEKNVLGPERKSAAPATDPTTTGARVINYYHDPDGEGLFGFCVLAGGGEGCNTAAAAVGRTFRN